MVRAKYRILGINQRWNDRSVVEGAPIMPRTKDWPQEENSEENAVFWSATPSGSLELTYKGDPPWTPDDAVYIDLEPSRDDEGWRLQCVSLYEGNVEVTFYGINPLPGCGHGTLVMMIDIEAAWGPFVSAGPGSRWAIAFTKA